MSGNTGSREEVLLTIVAHRQDLMEMGVTHAAIFGSVAKGTDRPDSDVDVMIDVDPTKVDSIFAMGRIQMRLSCWLGRSVDVARRHDLRPHVAAEAERESVTAF